MAYRNAPLSLISRLIYLLLRSLAWLGVAVFYRKRLLLGRENLRFDGPAIVIVNHPNTLLDVLVPGIHIHQEMFFLANYGLFKNPVTNWLFRKLFCIPVKRREDVTEGEARDLDETFEQCYQHLERQGLLFIAVEGTSWMNRFVREIKTGAARISFGAESRNQWKLDLKIVPIGLSYHAPNLFRSDAVVQVGTPVWPRDWAAAWQDDPEAAVDDLTLFLENQLKALSIHTRDEAGEQFIGRLETIAQNTEPLPQRADFFRSQQLVQEHLDDLALRDSTDRYFKQLDEFAVSDAGVAAAAAPGSTWIIFRNALLLLAGLPFFLAGYAFWFLPCFLPWLLNKRMNLYIGYSSAVKTLAGLITFPLALWGAYRLGKLAFHESWLALVVPVAAIFLGLLTERWLKVATRFRDHWKARAFARKRVNEFSNLVQQRSGILEKTTV